MKLFAPIACDAYKLGHFWQYPKDTTFVYSNLTPRSNRLFKGSSEYDGKVVFFGLQGALQEIKESWDESFFNQPKSKAVERYKRFVDGVLGEGVITYEHFEKLHDLGYLPICVRALPEGARVGMKIPVFTVQNTKEEFYWIVNYLETALSALTWKSSTNATIAAEYKKVLNKYAVLTGSDLEFVNFQGHDFSFRGMSGIEDAARVGVAHLTSFCGTDTLPALAYAEDYYDADGIVGFSVPATEHAVATANILTKEEKIKQNPKDASHGYDTRKAAEMQFIHEFITEKHPNGVVSYVSDSFDFWAVVSEIVPALKKEIMSRSGKLVLRPDSGCPIKILCGDKEAKEGSPEYKGAVEVLWERFGGTTTTTGHKLIDEHIGLIYGDSITIERAEAILEGLYKKGFASQNVVFGVGSFTYQMNTRDTFGFAVKATACTVDGRFVELYKDPKTDSGTKKSAKGFLRVELENDEYVLYDQQPVEVDGELKEVFVDGEFVKRTSIHEIRNRLK